MQDGLVMLSADADTPFSRFLPVNLPWSGPVKERPIRVLVAISNPQDLEQFNLPPVDVVLERATLQAAFDTVGPGRLRAEFLEPPVTLERLEKALREGRHHVLHLLGHGRYDDKRKQAMLYLQDAQGNARPARDVELAGMLARQGAQPQLVFLAACQSATRSTADAFVGLGPTLVTIGAPAVVAMQESVSIVSARTFSAAFYERLLKHGLVDLAANEARGSLLTAGRPDAAVPVLFMRLRDGRLWSGE
jgi:CHAT domain-containing protein